MNIFLSKNLNDANFYLKLKLKKNGQKINLID